jgi:general secretion pathway protein L
MATCFLFIGERENVDYPSLRLDEQGELTAPLEHRTIDAFKELQVNARTIVVLPTERCSLHYLELPKLGARKAQIAIPYALEEQLAQPLGSLHFAFDAHHHYHNHQYLVAVIDKAYLLELITQIQIAGISFDCITFDWFALNPHEMAIHGARLIIFNDTFQGVLTGEAASQYLASKAAHKPAIVFDNETLAESGELKTPEDSYYQWVAARLLKTTPINLCQGGLQTYIHQYSPSRWYQLCIALAGLSLVLFFIMNIITSYRLTQKLHETDRKIAVIYHQFFPNAAQVISPKFRISQLINNTNASADGALWQLLDKLASAIQHEAVAMQQLHYDHNILSVTLKSDNFAALESFEQRLQQMQVHVVQRQAASHNKKVLATLELHL